MKAPFCIAEFATVEDFCKCVMEVMTDSDLGGFDDPRVKLKERISSLVITEGSGHEKLRFKEPHLADIHP